MRAFAILISILLPILGGLPPLAAQTAPPMPAPSAAPYAPVAPAAPATEGAMPTVPPQTAAPVVNPMPEARPPAADNRLYAVGAGAIVGVVMFNMLTYPLGSVPFVAGPLAGTPADIALGSRLLAGLASGTGALAAHYYHYQTPAAGPDLAGHDDRASAARPETASAASEPAPTAPPDRLYPLVLAAGALAGIAAVNVMTHGLGTLPLTIGIETAAPIISPAAAAASRIFVIASGVLGVWIADALYPRAPGPDVPDPAAPRPSSPSPSPQG